MIKIQKSPMHYTFFNKLLRIFLLSSALCLTSCSRIASSFTPEPYVIQSKPKESYKSIAYFANKPSRAALRLGLLSLGGNGFSNFDDLIKEAKQKAADLGGDFVLAEKSGIDEKVSYSPGYSNYTANANASYGSSSGYGSGNASGYSVGPSATTIQRPWAVFSVWAYRPSKLGVDFDENHRVIGFHLNSDAEDVGIQLGDQLLGVDGYDVRDQAHLLHLMEINPGNKITLTFRRGEKKTAYSITALPN